MDRRQSLDFFGGVGLAVESLSVKLWVSTKSGMRAKQAGCCSKINSS